MTAIAPAKDDGGHFNQISSKQSKSTLFTAGHNWPFVGEAPAFLAVSFILLLVIMSPFLLIEFAHHDDWLLFSKRFRDEFALHNIPLGRILFDTLVRTFVFPIVGS